MSEFKLIRVAYTDQGVFGDFYCDGSYLFKTVERPWRENQPYISCIPTGTYHLIHRQSGVVNRSTGGEFKSGWELAKVPNRTFIMIHPANTSNQLEGCIAPGMRLGVVNDRWAVTESRKAFKLFMRHATDNDVHSVTIENIKGAGEL